MVHSKIPLDQKRARTFARAIYRDISSYIRTHQEEYKAFVESIIKEDCHEHDQSACRPRTPKKKTR